MTAIPLGSVAGAGELILLSAAAAVRCRLAGYTVAEALAAGLIIPLAALSAALQLSGLTGTPAVAVAAEAGLVLIAGAALLGRDSLRALREMIAAPIWMTRHHRGVAGILLVAVGGVGVILASPSMLTPPAGPWVDGPPSVIGPVPPGNIAVLTHLFSGEGAGAGLLGLWGYLAAGAATYAMARRYAWPPTALTASLVVLSYPLFVQAALLPGGVTLPAASAALGLLYIHRLAESPTGVDLILMANVFAFSVVAGPAPFALPIILLGLAALILYRRHGASIWWPLLGGAPRRVWAAVLPLLILSQIPRLGVNLLRDGTAYPPSSIPLNPDGIVGAAGNLLRDILATGAIPAPADALVRDLTGISPAAVIERLYSGLVFPLVDGRGAVVPFRVLPDSAAPGGFGPLALLLVLPALCYAAIRGSRRIKAMAVALLGYLYLLTLMVGWTPEAMALLARIYVPGGFCVALILPPWRLTRTGKRVIQGICLVLLGLSVASLLPPMAP